MEPHIKCYIDKNISDISECKDDSHTAYCTAYCLGVAGALFVAEIITLQEYNISIDRIKNEGKQQRANHETIRPN